MGQQPTQASCENWDLGLLGPILDLPLDHMQVEGLVARGSYVVLILIFGTINIAESGVYIRSLEVCS